MPILDDEQFERYLKEFRPVAPESLQIQEQPSPARPHFAYLAWAAACVALLLVFVLWHRLTIGRANALLVHAPSLREAFNELSFQPQPASQPEGKKSALAALSKENFKL